MSPEVTPPEQEYPKVMGELDPGMKGVLDRLADQRDEIATLERRLAAAKKRRAALIAKARHGGLTLRAIEPFAGVTNVRISQMENSRA